MSAGSSEPQSIFYDEWRACLRAHYMDVIRSGDSVTRPTLRGVLLQVGFSDAEIEQMMAEAHGAPESQPLPEASPVIMLPGFS